MEAPTKSGGTRKPRQGRALIGRLSTLPPIEFLKKHNPLRHRRRRPQIGFDQPLQEIKKLALPLRPAPPSLSMRLFVRVRPLGEWVGTWCAAVSRMLQAQAVRTGRHIGSMAGRAWAGLRPVFAAVASLGRICRARVAALRQTRLVRVCERQVQRFTQRLSVLLQPAVWQPAQSAALMLRTQRVRRVLVGVVVCEWTAMIGLMLMLAALLVTGRGWDRASVNACGLILSVLSLVALSLQAWHQRLVGAWRSMELFMCGSCGGLRNFSPALQCPKCGVEDAPVFPGQVPVAWTHWQSFVSPLSAGSPALLASALLLSSRLF